MNFDLKSSFLCLDDADLVFNLKMKPIEIELENSEDLQTTLLLSIESSKITVTLKDVLDSQRIWLKNEQFGVLTEVFFVGGGKKEVAEREEGKREEGMRRAEGGREEGGRDGSWRREGVFEEGGVGEGRKEGGRRVGRREEEARSRGEVSDPIYSEEIKLPRYTPKSLGALIDFLIEIEAVNNSAKFKRLLQEYK